MIVWLRIFCYGFPHTFDGRISAACSCASCLWKSCIIIIIIIPIYLLFLFAVPPWQHCQAQVTPGLVSLHPHSSSSPEQVHTDGVLLFEEMVWRFLDPTDGSQPAWAPDSTRSNSSPVTYCFIYGKKWLGFFSYQDRRSCLSVRNISDQWWRDWV